MRIQRYLGTLSATKLRILDRAQQPSRWTDLLDLTGITPKALLDHLNWLKGEGLVRKDETTGLYSVTKKGRSELSEGRQLLERTRVLEWADEHLDEVKKLMASKKEGEKS